MSLAKDLRKYAPATQRNRQPILAVLQQWVNPTGNILEIASGTGEHAVFFAPFFPNCLWFPSDQDESSLESIQAWQRFQPSDRLQLPQRINILEAQWWQGLEPLKITTMININMLHISPWEACLGLMKGAGELLPPEGILYLYGPYQQAGKEMVASNQAFDQSLRLQNPSWGIRSLEEVIKLAEEKGLQLQEIVEMPANNLSVILRKVARVKD